MGNIIKIKHGASEPGNATLAQWEPGLDTDNNVLYINKSNDPTAKDLVGYLPLSAGSNAKIIGNLYINGNSAFILFQRAGVTQAWVGLAGDQSFRSCLSDGSSSIAGMGGAYNSTTDTGTVTIFAKGNDGHIYLNPTTYNNPNAVVDISSGATSISGNLTINNSVPYINIQKNSSDFGRIYANTDSNSQNFLRIDGPGHNAHITLNGTSGAAIIAADSSTIYFRPNNSTTKQATIDSSGDLTIAGDLVVSGEQTSGHSYAGDGSSTDTAISSAWSEHAIKSFTGLATGGHYILFGNCVVDPTSTGNARLTIKGYSGSEWKNLSHQIFPLPNSGNNWASIVSINSGYTGYQLCLTCGVGTLKSWLFRYIRVC